MASLESRLRRLESGAPAAGSEHEEIGLEAGLAVKVRLAIAAEAEDGHAERAGEAAVSILESDGPAAARAHVAGLWAEVRRMTAAAESPAVYMGINPADLTQGMGGYSPRPGRFSR